MTKARTLADNFAADINGITAGTGITGGGTSGTVTVTNDMATTIAAKGDLIVGTGNDTYAALTVASTTGYTLVADSAEATGLKWATVSADSMTQLATGSLSGSQVSLTSISGSYKDLVLVVRDPSVSGDGNRALFVFLNNDQTGLYQAYNSSNTNSTNLAATSTEVSITPTILENSSDGLSVTRFYDYANSTTYKQFERWAWVQNAATPTWSVLMGSGFYRSTSAISRIDIGAVGGSSTLAGTYILYGVK